MKKISKVVGLSISLIFMTACASLGENLPRFTTSDEKIAEQKAIFKDSRFGVLYLLMVNSEGAVVKSRIIDYKNKQISEDMTRELIRQIEKKLHYQPSSIPFREEFYYLVINNKIDLIN